MSHDHDHHEVQKNPEYDGPAQHCLPPPVESTLPQGIGMVLLAIAGVSLIVSQDQESANAELGLLVWGLVAFFVGFYLVAFTKR
jgi:hypothetical protein